MAVSWSAEFMLDRFDRRREDDESASAGALFVVARLLRLDFRLEEAECEVFSFVLVEPVMPSWFSIVFCGLFSFRRVLVAGSERFGWGAAAVFGIFCRLCFRDEGPEFDVEEAGLSLTGAFLLRPSVKSEACSDDGSLLGTSPAFSLSAVDGAAGWPALLAA